MANDALTRFISERRARSVPDDAIKADLLRSGWQSHDIELALMQASRTPIQSLAGPASSSREDLSPDEFHVIGAWSSGAMVPFFYSGFMRLWSFFLAELAVFLLPVSISFLPIFQAGGSLQLFGGLFLWAVFLPVASLTLLALRVVYGKRLAWKVRSWTGFDQFLAVQKKWDIAGRVLLIIVLPPGTLAILGIVFTSGLYTLNAKRTPSGTTLSPNPTVSVASSSPLIDNGTTVILGKSNGGYARIAQLFINPTLTEINGITLGTSMEAGSRDYDINTDIVAPITDISPNYGAILFAFAFGTVQNGELTAGSASGTSYPFGISLTSPTPQMNAESGHYFLVLRQPTTTNGQSDTASSAIELSLRDAKANEVLLGSYITADQAQDNTDKGSWQVIKGKALDYSIQ